MKTICIDARMALNAGIGTYIRKLLPSINQAFSMKVLVSLADVEKWPELELYDLIPVKAPIYSIQDIAHAICRNTNNDFVIASHIN